MIGGPRRDGRAWGTVRTSVATLVRAPRDRVAALFLDYDAWPRIFPVTIAGTRLLERTADSLQVMVDHRREGQVLNVLRTPAPGVVELTEHKPRFDATFVNRFEAVKGGTRCAIDAAVRLKWPYAPLAPFLRGVVERALRRYTLEPLRAAAEGGAGD